MRKSFDATCPDERRPKESQAIELIGGFGHGPGVVGIRGFLDDFRRVDRGTKQDRGASQPVLGGQRAQEKPGVERARLVGNEIGDHEKETDRIRPAARTDRTVAGFEIILNNQRDQPDDSDCEVNGKGHVTRSERVSGAISHAPQRSQKGVA